MTTKSIHETVGPWENGPGQVVAPKRFLRLIQIILDEPVLAGDDEIEFDGYNLNHAELLDFAAAMFVLAGESAHQDDAGRAIRHASIAIRALARASFEDSGA
jgi:hypothetical protein